MNANKDQVMEYGAMSAHKVEIKKETAQDNAMKQGVVSAEDTASIGTVIKTAIDDIRAEGTGSSDFVTPGEQLVKDTIAAVGAEKAMELGVMGMPDEAVEKAAAADEKAQKIMEDGVKAAQ